jgi:acyl-CoA hydrolase
MSNICKTHLIDIVFPGETNHHGTLFGGNALSYMDKVAFICASRFGRCAFVTASCERIDFQKPAFEGQIVDFEASVTKIGNRSLEVTVLMQSEDLLTGKRVTCTKGIFNMVAIKDKNDPNAPHIDLSKCKYQEPSDADYLDAPVKMVELVFNDQTNHYGTLFGGYGLSMMGKASFIAATQHCREVMVMAALRRTDFQTPIKYGEIIEIVAKTIEVRNTSCVVNVKMWGENLLTGERHLCADSEFIMVATDKNGGATRINL